MDFYFPDQGLNLHPALEGEVLTTVPPGKYLWDIFKPTIQTLFFSHSHAWLFVTPWTVAHQTSLSFTISQSLLKLVSNDIPSIQYSEILLRKKVPFKTLLLIDNTSWLPKSSDGDV